MREPGVTRSAIDAETARVQAAFATLAETARQDIKEAWHEAGYRVDHMTPRRQALELEGEKHYDRLYDPQTYQENLGTGAYNQIDRLWRRHAAEEGLDARPSWERGADIDVSR